MSDAASLPITFEPSAPDALRGEVADGLRAHNEARHGPAGLEPVAFLVRDGDRVVAGLLGRLWWRWLHVEKLWVSEGLRGRGVGGRLLDAAEHHARERGCVGAALDTIDPAAYAFYTRRGYEPFGVLEDFPPGARQWFLRRRLDGAPAGGDADASR